MCSSVCKFIRQVSLIGIFVALCLPVASEAYYWIQLYGGVNGDETCQEDYYKRSYSFLTETQTSLDATVSCGGSAASSSGDLVTTELHTSGSSTPFFILNNAPHNGGS